jgi:hypothetical protein
MRQLSGSVVRSDHVPGAVEFTADLPRELACSRRVPADTLHFFAKRVQLPKVSQELLAINSAQLLDDFMQVQREV